MAPGNTILPVASMVRAAGGSSSGGAMATMRPSRTPTAVSTTSVEVTTRPPAMTRSRLWAALMPCAPPWPLTIPPALRAWLCLSGGQPVRSACGRGSRARACARQVRAATAGRSRHGPCRLVDRATTPVAHDGRRCPSGRIHGHRHRCAEGAGRAGQRPRRPRPRARRTAPGRTPGPRLSRSARHAGEAAAGPRAAPDRRQPAPRRPADRRQPQHAPQALPGAGAPHVEDVPVRARSGRPGARYNTGAMPPIRVLVAKVGLDGHDRGVKIVARALRDAGMDVIYTGLHRTPEEVVAAAVQEDVDVVGVSLLSGAHMTLIPRLATLLREARADAALVVGGVIPDEDVPALKAAGAVDVVLQDTPPDEVVRRVRDAAASRAS